MEANIVYWKDFEKFEINRIKEELAPIKFKSADRAYWKLLVSDESLEVKKGEVNIIKIKDLELPPYTVISPLMILRNAFGSVIDVFEEKPSKIEENKVLKAVAFLSVRDGRIETGDLLGVIKVYAVGTAPSREIGKIEPPQVNIKLEKHDVNLVFSANGVGREKTRIGEYWYRRWHLAEWYPLIAAEDCEVTAGSVELIKIKPIELPENTIPVPLYIMRHALGTVLDVYHPGKPRRVENKKLISRAIFMPVFSGEVKRGDLLGVLNVYYISVGERVASLVQHLIKSEKANLVYWKNGEIRRSNVAIELFSFKRSSIGWFMPLIAKESKEVRGKVEFVEIEELELPSGTIVQPIALRNHVVGSVIDVATFEPPKRVEEDKTLTHAVVMVTKGGRIEKGDVLGVLSVYHVSILREPELFVAKYRKR